MAGWFLEAATKPSQTRHTYPFPWHKTTHRHAILGLMTPANVHHGLAEQCVAA